MSAIRTIVVSAATLFLGLTGLFLAAGPASAVTSQTYSIDCVEDWHTPCP